MRSFRNVISGLRASLATLGVGRLGVEAAQAADSVALLQNKLRLVTRDERELARTQQLVIDLARETRQRFESVGDLYARVARSTEQLGATQEQVLTVTRAVSQAIQISGNTAIEAEAGMIQLSQALASGVLRGDELRSVLEQMPRVARAIADGLGVTVGQLRELGAAGKLTSEQVFKALIGQAGELNSEFKQLKPTIGQTFVVLKNDLKLATAGLLEATGVTTGLTAAFTGLAAAIRGSVGLMTFIVEKVTALATQSHRVASAVRGILAALPIVGQAALLAEAAARNDRRRGPAPGGSRQLTSSSGLARDAVAELNEVHITARRVADEVPQFLQQMNEGTRTEFGRTNAELHAFREELEALLSERRIDAAEFNARLGERIDETLLIDLKPIRALYKDVRKETSELGEFMKGVWQGVGQSIQATLSDALYEWRLSWRGLLDIARRALADILSAIITSGIKNALQQQASGTSSGSSGSSTGGWLRFIGSLFGFAGGGRFDGLRMVGESGPELVAGSGRVFNQRQLAFGGVGANITFAPTTNVQIIERENAERTKAELVEYIETRNAQSQQEFIRTLGRSGFEVKG